MKYKITRIYHLDLGHRFWKNFNFKEQYHLHGHTFDLYVTFVSNQLSEENNSVLDTDIINSIVKPLVNKLDHSFVFDRNDPFYANFKNFLLENESNYFPKKFIIIEGQPTYEKLAEFIFLYIKEKLEKLDYNNVILESVRLKGATNTIAEVYND